MAMSTPLRRPARWCMWQVSMASLAILFGGMVSCAPRLIVDTNDQGIVRREGQVEGRLQTGEWVYHDDHGQIEAQGEWRRDKQFGEWQWWYPDGNLKQQGSYALMGNREGWWQFYYPSGVLQTAGEYGVDSQGFADRQHGVWQYFRESGAFAARGSFVDGRRALWWTVHNEAGERQTQGCFYDGVRVGPWLTLDGWKDAGVPAGWSAYSEPQVGQPRRWGMMRDQRPDGVWALYREDGSPKAACVRGTKLNSLMVYDTTGQPTEWARLGKNGEWIIRYYDAGQPMAQASTERVAQVRDHLAQLVQDFSAPLTHTIGAPDAAAATAVAEAFEAAAIADNGATRDTVLSPQPVLPGLWTQAEESSVASLIRTYEKGRIQGPVAYDFATAPGGDRSRSTKLEGRSLVDGRVLSAQGSVLSFGDAQHRRTAIVILRGFSGQVCIYCAAQTAAIANQMAAFQERNVRVILLYPGSAESVPVFLQAVASLGSELPTDIELAIDPNLGFVRSLGIEHMLALPSTLLLNSSGTVDWAYVGASKDDRPAVSMLLDQLEGIP